MIRKFHQLVFCFRSFLLQDLKFGWVMVMHEFDLEMLIRFIILNKNVFVSVKLNYVMMYYSSLISFSLHRPPNHLFAPPLYPNTLMNPNSRSRPKETPLSTSMHLLSSSEHLSSGYSSSHTPIPASDYLMPVSTETMVNGQHCRNFSI